jgi:hypothetical protein
VAPPDLDALVLWQMAGLEAPLLSQLLAREETPPSSGALRAAGLAVLATSVIRRRIPSSSLT